MKILQVVQFFSPNHGGSAMASYELSKQLQKKGHEITVLTTDFQMNNLFIDSLDGVKVIPFHCQLNIGGFLISSSMNEYLKKNIDKFDIIHLHNFRTYQNIITRKYAIKHNVPYILQPRGSIPTTRKSKQKKIFDIIWGQSIIKDARKIIATSIFESSQYNTFSKLTKGKIVHIPNGINLEMYKSLPKKGCFKEKYSIDSNVKVILFLGRIHEIKGTDILIEAFSELKTIFENLILVIAGPDDGYLFESKLIARNLNLTKDVMFTGPIYEQDKLEAYVDADIFVLPSKYESFGNVALEAFACGTPVIVTNNCGISEWINDEVGCVVEYDKDQLRDSIIKILTDEQLELRFREKSIKLVREKFGWEPIVGMMEDMYRSCLV